VVDVYDCYVQMDVDGDGISELWRVRVAGMDGTKLIDKERARFVPYCTGTALPMPHRLSGTSMFDLLKPIQDGKTHILRQYMDNLNVANNSRVGAVEGEVNMSDVIDSKPGGVIRLRSADALFPIPFNDVGPAALTALQYMDNIRTERGGAALDMMSGEMQIAGTSATAAANEYGHKEKASTMYCRNLVESLVKGAFLLIHRSLRHYYNGELTSKLGGKWQTTNPRDWLPRDYCKVIAGMSSSERQQRSAALAQNLSYQTTAMQAGMDGTLVSVSNIHNTLQDWLRSSDLDDVDSYYIDPDSEEAQAAAQQKQENMLKEAEKAEQLQRRLFDQEQALKKYMHDSQLQFDKWEQVLKAAVEEMKITGKAVADQELELTKGTVAAITNQGKSNGTANSDSRD
jgi:hypothetical protein